jgi:hypothetical protein
MKDKDKKNIPMKNKDIDKLIKAAKNKTNKVAEKKIAGLQGLSGLQTGLGNQFNEKKKKQ